MPKVTTIQEGFSSGEVSPIYYGRVSSDRYKESMGTTLNWLPTLQGPLIRRPGTKYVLPVKDSTKPPVLIPFIISATQAYQLEFGDGYVRFYTNDGQIISPTNYYQIYSNIGYSTRLTLNPLLNEQIFSSNTVTGPATLQLQTIFQFTDVSLIKWAQNKNILYLTHPSYPTMKIIQYSAYEWSIQYVNFIDGPYKPLNSWTTLADGAGITLTPSATSGNMNLVSGPSYGISTYGNNGSGAIRVTTSSAHSYVTGQKVFISGVSGGSGINNANLNNGSFSYWVITVINSTNFDLVGSNYSGVYVSGGTVYPAIVPPITSNSSAFGFFPYGYGQQFAIVCSDGFRYYGTINLPTSPGYANSISWTLNAGLTLPNTSTINFWYLGVWAPRLQDRSANFFAIGDQPGCVTFHQDRLCLSGTLGTPGEIDMSVVSNYETFSPSPPNGTNALQPQANSAIQVTLLSRDVNAIRWLSSAVQGLLAGSYESEWMIAPSANYEALTPTNINALQTSYFGSSASDCVRVNNATLYMQRSGRKLREMNFFFQVGTFRSTDLSEISEHLTIGGVSKLVVQRETQPTVWALRNDGTLLSMTYNRDDTTLKAGWARHQLGGNSDSAGTPPIVYSMAVIPDPSALFDQLWLVIQRWINGAKVYTIEYMTQPYNDSILQEDAFQFDCGVTYYNPLTIAGITTASPAVVTIPAHGYSNGDRIKITGVNGLNTTSTDINGNVTKSNLVNEKVFTVENVTTNTFTLQDSFGNAVSSVGASPYLIFGYAAKLITTITGLTFLENETVNILADGCIHPPVVVSNTGSITLQFPAAKVQIGYGYNSDGQLLRANAGSAEGTSIGQTRRVNRAAVMLHNAGDFSMGMSLTNLIACQFPKADQNQADSTTTFFSGIHRDGVESEYTYDDQFSFRSSSGLPAMVNAVTLFLEENDV